MKKFVLLQLFTLACTSILVGQDLLNENRIKSVLKEVFDLSQNQDYSALSKKLLDQETLKPYNYKNKNDQKTVKRIGKKIKAYLDLSDSYEYENLALAKFKNLSSAELDVIFRSGDQNLTISFIFVEYQGNLYLTKFN